MKEPELVKFIGLVVPADQEPFWPSGSSIRSQMKPGAFSESIKRVSACFTPILIGHDECLKLFQHGETRWRIDKDGLKVAFTLSRTGYHSDLAIDAIRHGWINHLSPSWITIHSIKTYDDQGWVNNHLTAEIEEVSITHQPAMLKTWLVELGAPIPRQRTIPDDANRADLLKAWLENRGVFVGRWDQIAATQKEKAASALPVRYLDVNHPEISPSWIDHINNVVGVKEGCEYRLHPSSPIMRAQWATWLSECRLARKNWLPAPYQTGPFR